MTGDGLEPLNENLHGNVFASSVVKVFLRLIVVKA
jgi:hypothetical protein